MTKYLLVWDSGFGENTAELEFDTHQEAVEHAYTEARDDFESNAEYEAKEITQDVIDEYGLEGYDND